MESVRDIWSQIKQLKREMEEHPWLAARLADLLRQVGREKEALELLRTCVQRNPEYISAWQMLGELQLQLEKPTEASRSWRQAADLSPGSHVAWQQLLDAEEIDPARHKELLERVWKLDNFSLRHLRKMEDAGLLQSEEYQQALRPTPQEAERREEVFRKIMKQQAGASTESVAKASPQTDSPHPEPEVPTEPTESSRTGETKKPELSEESASPDETLASPAELAALPARDAELPAEQLEASTQDHTADQDVSPLAESVVDPEQKRQEERTSLLAQQSAQLEALAVHKVATEEAQPAGAESGRQVRSSTSRGMHTKALARIYLEQEYPRLALQVLALLLKELPQDRELKIMKQQARRQLTEKRDALAVGRARRKS